MSAFDTVAHQYDTHFTYSACGLLQRQRVWQYLEGILPKGKSWRILELNCGTGEDAIWLARKGHQVMATDAAQEMVACATAKAQTAKLAHAISFKQMTFGQLAQADFGPPFDLVFSNFGGLNCIGPKALRQLSIDLAGLLAPHGRFVAVLMPDFCLWEVVYFSLKMNADQALRRARGKAVEAQLGDRLLPIWYYRPALFASFFNGHFRKKSLQPIGISLPPSYLDPFFKKRLRWLSFLNRMEGHLTRYESLAGLADHFLLDLQRIR